MLMGVQKANKSEKSVVGGIILGMSKANGSDVWFLLWDMVVTRSIVELLITLQNSEGLSKLLATNIVGIVWSKFL